MIITRRDVDALNAVLTVKIEQADYQVNVKKELEKHRKTAKIPGFRPGHVPFGLIEKKFGKAILAEQLDRIVRESLFDYIKDNSIDILGNPIPKEGADLQGSFDRPDSFEFEFEIGLSPTFDIPISSKSKYDYLQVKIDEDLVNKQIDDLTRRYGKLSSVEVVGEKDMILTGLVELNDDESIKEGGIIISSTISLEFIENKSAKNLLIGKTIGDKVIMNPVDVSRGGKDLASMLGIKEEELSTVSSKFELTINEIKRMESAALDQELFDKLFGQDVIHSETELRDRITEDLKGMFSNDADRILTRSIFNDLLEKTKVDLPNSFLKRWIKLSNEKEVTDEQIEAEYDGYAKGLKWKLIQGNLFKSNGIKIEGREILDYTKGLLVRNYAQYGIPAPTDEELSSSALSILKNQEEAMRINDMLAEEKLTALFKSTVKLNEKRVTYDEFKELASI